MTNTDIEVVRGRGISNDVDLSKGLSILEKNIKTREIIPKDIDEVPEPDDAEIEKMILNDDEKALKTRLWKSLNHDWIAQDREKKRARKADKKKHKLMSAQQSSLRSDK